jgi:hypothetical protein
VLVAPRAGNPDTWAENDFFECFTKRATERVLKGEDFMEKADPMALVCALPEGDRAQRRSEIQSLLQKRTAFTRHPDGVELEWRFSEETARSLLDFILFERTCCKTFTYELRFAPPHDRITLRMRASTEQVDALQSLYC